MKKKTDNKLEEIIHDYGSLEAYNEEQRRFALITIETTLRANPFTGRISIENALPIEVKVVKAKPKRRQLRFKLFGTKLSRQNRLKEAKSNE